MADNNSEINIHIPRSLTGIVDIIGQHKSETPCHFMALPNSKVELMFLMEGSEFESFHIDAHKSQFLPNDSNKFVMAFSSQTHPVQAKYRRLNAINVVMNPVAAMAILEIPAKEIKDLHIEPTALGNLNQLRDELTNLETFQQRAHYLEKFLYNRLYTSKYFNWTQELIGNVKMLHMGCYPSFLETEINLDKIYYSRSHFHRLCKDWLGVTYDEYQLHKKFRRAMYAINHDKFTLTEIAYHLEFYDSSHLARTFKRFTGLNPTEYKNSKKGLIPEFVLKE
jgi:AraC-like DNA-binding protein